MVFRRLLTKDWSVETSSAPVQRARATLSVALPAVGDCAPKARELRACLLATAKLDEGGSESLALSEVELVNRTYQNCVPSKIVSLSNSLRNLVTASRGFRCTTIGRPMPR